MKKNRQPEEHEMSPSMLFYRSGGMSPLERKRETEWLRSMAARASRIAAQRRAAGR